jgi:acyl dehydratase
MKNDGLVIGRITEADVAMMRERIGYPNPTLRKGVLRKPWNTVATADAIRRWAECTGDTNPLYNEDEYAKHTRWGGPIAPPGFEWSMGIDRALAVPEELNARTHRALRGVQLYHSGAEYVYFNPIREGSRLFKSEYVADIEEKQSRFASRSVIVNNETYWWDQEERVAITSSRWFVHAERQSLADKAKPGEEESIAAEDMPEKPGNTEDRTTEYSDQQLAEIEAAYDQEYQRGKDTLYLEDVKVGQSLPRMVKGPLTITDMINIHMGAGWLTYGNPPYRLAYENRKLLRGFYSRNEFNAWDTVQRVHWDVSLARRVGVKNLYDIGPMRFVMLCHYLTNFAGDDAWVHRIRYELRAFNYVGDTTWITGIVTGARIDPVLGPLIELEIKGTNQREQHNIIATATILVASRVTGLPKLPPPAPMTPHRAA